MSIVCTTFGGIEPRLDDETLTFADAKNITCRSRSYMLAEAALCRRPRLKTLYTSGYAENSIVHRDKLDPGGSLPVETLPAAGLGAQGSQGARHGVDP